MIRYLIVFCAIYQHSRSLAYGKSIDQVPVVHRNIRSIVSSDTAFTRNEVNVENKLRNIAKTLPGLPGNSLQIGQCTDINQRVYTDHTIVENSGPSTLNGTMEIYINAPISITCIKIEDQITDGSGAIPSYEAGGVGYNWVHIGLQGQYGKGFHFKIHIFGVPLSRKLYRIY